MWLKLGDGETLDWGLRPPQSFQKPFCEVDGLGRKWVEAYLGKLHFWDRRGGMGQGWSKYVR